MFKLLVVSCLLAFTAAEPGVFYSAPLPALYSAPVATYLQSSYIPSQVYSDIAYPHLIKKRSPQSEGYAAQAIQSTSKYSAPPPSTPKKQPVQTTYASSEHYTQKRSAPFFTPSSYIAAPVASTYVSAPLDLTYSSILPSHYSGYTGYAAGLPLIK